MRGTRLWLVIAMITGLLATAVVAGCGDDEESSSSGGSSDSGDLGLIEDGTLIVGSDIPYPPFEKGDPPEYEGFDIDLINAIAEKMELETQIEDAPFDLILTGGGGQFDLSISATTITPARENRVDFSDPYFISSQGLLVQEGSDIASIEDITADTIVGAEDGTTGETYANDNSDAGEVRGFPAVDDAFNALSVGQVEAVISDGPVVEDAAENKEGLEVVEIFPTDEEYGIILPEGSDALLEAVNAALQEVKDEGVLEDLYDEHIGVPAPEELNSATHDAT
ncbi:MAG: ABC transporter substrate-binding protein [Solirubrobacterales bacterium]